MLHIDTIDMNDSENRGNKQKILQIIYAVYVNL